MANKFIAIAFDKEGKVVVVNSCAHQTETEIKHHTHGNLGEVLLLEVIGNDLNVLDHRIPEVPAPKPKAKKKGD